MSKKYTKPVPTRPEPLEALRQRYQRALEYVYEEDTIRTGGIRPGEVAANIFDFDDGLRLIVSRERLEDGSLVLHFSASFPPQCRMADEMRLLKPFHAPEHLLKMWAGDIPWRFAELSGDHRPVQFVGFSDRGMPHWKIEEA